MIGRKKEYSLLQSLCDSNNFELLVMYGRRRVGKTYLLANYLSSHAGVYFMAKDKDDEGNVIGLWKALSRYYGDVPEFAKPKSLSDILDFIDSREEVLFLVLDEYQWLGENREKTDSTLQGYVDKWKRENKNIKIVLCGSVITAMSDLVDDKQSPLYGRATAKLHLLPFSYLEMSEYFPNASSKEKLEAFMMTGGLPYYLDFYRTGDTPIKYISRNIVSTTGALRDEVNTLMKEEIRKSGPYLRVLESIAEGKTSFNELSQLFDNKSALLSSYLDTLENRLHIIEKKEPRLGGKGKAHYVICDHFCLMYFSLIYPHIDDPSFYLEEESFASAYLSEERISAFFGVAFESVCHHYMNLSSAKGLLPHRYPIFDNHWEKDADGDHEFDLASSTKKNELALGECKWTNKPLSATKYFEMLKFAERHGYKGDNEFYFFAKNGFSERLIELSKQHNNIHLIQPDDLFRI